jgi:hypothetical protein
MSLWGGFRRKAVDEEYDEGVDPEEVDYLSDILGEIEAGIKEQREYNEEAMQLFRGILEELQAIRNAIPAFHEGVNVALEMAREVRDDEAQKRHDEMVDAMEDERDGMEPLI